MNLYAASVAVLWTTAMRGAAAPAGDARAAVARAKSRGAHARMVARWHGIGAALAGWRIPAVRCRVPGRGAPRRGSARE
jgi:hypothetical protein